MSHVVTQEFELVGPNKGKTLKLRQYQFVDGKLSITCPVEVMATHTRYLGEVNGWAQPVGSASQEADPDAQDSAPPDANERLKRALAELDPANDDHWTQSGKPAMAAVEILYGSADVTRAQIDAIAPDLLRTTAPQLKKE